MKFQSQFTIQKGTNLMTPEAERFNGWAAMLGLRSSSRSICYNRKHYTRYFLNEKRN